MFEKTPDSKSGLEKAINDILEKLESTSPDSDEYNKMSEQLERLYKLKEVDSKSKVSPDVLVSVAFNVVAIIWMTRYERDNVFTSKALSFIRTLRP